MNRTWRVNAALFVMLSSGIGLTWWLDHRETAQKEADKGARRVGAMSSDSVTRILFQGEQNDVMTLEKKDKEWNIVAPTALRTAADAGNKLLKLLDAVYERKASDKNDNPINYGFTAKSVAITFENSSGKKQTIRLGTNAPIGSNRYLLVDEQGPVVLIPSGAISSLPKEADALRDKRLFTGLSAQDTLTISIARANETLTLARNSEAKWQLTAPFTDQTDSARVDSWVEMIASATGSGFMKSAPTTTPDWVVAMTNKEEKEVKIAIWRQGSELLAQRPDDPDAMRLYSYIGKELDKAPEELSGLTPLAEGTTLDQLVLTQNEQTLEASKQDGKWSSPAWNTLAEVLTTKARSAATPVERGAPTFSLTIGDGESRPTIPFWKDDKTYLLAPHGRPVHLRLTPLQSESVDEALKTLVPPAAKAESVDETTKTLTPPTAKDESADESNKTIHPTAAIVESVDETMKTLNPPTAKAE